jgi:hypothetical protein
LTGSLLWDSQNNHWIYSNPSGSSYSGGMFISGPRTSTLGSETGTTSCMLLAGQGGDHLTSSMIYHDSTVTCIPNILIGSTICTTMANASCVGIGTITPLTILEVSANNNALGCNNTLRFTDTDTATEANQQIGKIEFYSNDTSTPGAGVKAYMGAFASDTTPDAYLSFATQDGSATPNPAERLRISSEGIACFSGAVCAPIIHASNNIQIGYGGAPAGTGKLFISRGDQYGLNINAQSGYVRIQGDDDLLAINRGGVDILSMSTCNHLGIRTTASPWAALRVCQCTSNADYAVRVQAVFGINDYLDSDANRIFGGGLSETQFLNGSSSRPAMISLGGNLATSEALGVINFFRSDNASTYRSRAQIWAATNGSGCSTTLGGYITLTTADTGETNPTQKLTIFSNGISCFACRVCAPAFTGGTISGTSITGTSMTVATDCSGVIVDVAGRHGLMKYFNYGTGLIGSCGTVDGSISMWIGRFAGTITSPTALYQDLTISNSGVANFSCRIQTPGMLMGSIGHYQNYRSTSGCFAIFCASQGAILYVTSMHNNGRSTAIINYANGVTAGAAISIVNQVIPYGPAALGFGVCANGWVYGYAQYGGPMDFYAIQIGGSFNWAF